MENFFDIHAISAPNALKRSRHKNGLSRRAEDGDRTKHAPKRRTWIWFPLPKGESQGEGEQGVRLAWRSLFSLGVTELHLLFGAAGFHC